LKCCLRCTIFFWKTAYNTPNTFHPARLLSDILRYRTSLVAKPDYLSCCLSPLAATPWTV